MKAFKKWYAKEKTQDVLNEFYDYVDVAEESWKAALEWALSNRGDIMRAWGKEFIDTAIIKKELNAK